MPPAKPITEYRITAHALDQMLRRGITEEDVAKVLAAPEQSESLRAGREGYQAQVRSGEPPKTYLLRVIVDIDREPAEVVTVYRTSRVAKYWRTGT
jgi:hypothetical protein